MIRRYFFLIFFLSCISIGALPVLSPADPALLTGGLIRQQPHDCFGIKFGYTGDFVFADNFKSTATGKKVAQVSTFENAGVLTLNFIERIDLYSSFGELRYVEYDTRGSDAFYFKSTSGFQWAVGIKGIFWQKSYQNYGTSYIGIDIKYAESNRIPLSYGTLNGALASQNISAKLHANQCSLGLAHSIGFFVPYFSIYWKNARAISNGAFAGEVLATIKHYNNFGIAFGATLLDHKRMNITAEARFLAEQSVTINGMLRF